LASAVQPGRFPFYIVGLPAFKHRSEVPVEDSWAEMRDAQYLIAKAGPHSCLAVTIDTGDPDNIHPVDKKEGGERLAFCALGEHYGRKVLNSGPDLVKAERLPGAVKLHFGHADGGLVMKGEKLAEFSVAGDDRKWYWAEARLEGTTVIVSSPSVPNPKGSATPGRPIRRRPCSAARLPASPSAPTTGQPSPKAERPKRGH
jgi:sialate O-acetylesterase